MSSVHEPLGQSKTLLRVCSATFRFAINSKQSRQRQSPVVLVYFISSSSHVCDRPKWHFGNTGALDKVESNVRIPCLHVKHKTFNYCWFVKMFYTENKFENVLFVITATALSCAVDVTCVCRELQERDHGGGLSTGVASWDQRGVI